MSYMESLAEINYRVEHGKIPSRPTTYHGIRFRSRLEIRYAMHLEELGEQWVYEPRVYGSAGKGYLPDFQILTAERPTFIEIKPTVAEAPAAQRKMEVIWETHPDALLIVACEEQARYFVALKGQDWETWQERWVA